MSETTRDSFRQNLEQISRLAAEHPDYRFEYIQGFTSQLGTDAKAWVEDIDKQWQQLPAPRQEACQQIFEYALLRARQATYKPVNALDQFLERQLYGIEDEQAIQKGSVSQALKQFEDRKRPAAPGPQSGPQAGTPPGQLPQTLQPQMPPRAQVAGRTNPLNPRQLPKGPEAEKG